MRRLLVACLLSLVLAACDTVIIPPQLAPIRDRTLDCRYSECSMGERGSRGEL